MKLYIFTIFYIIHLSSYVFAGPFGLDMGMSIEQVKTACNGRSPSVISDNKYYIIPQKPHPDFSIYVAWISPTEGLYFLKAVGSNISTSSYGTSLKSKFKDISDRLSKTYGNPKEYDFLRANSIWHEPNEWMKSLEKQERFLCSTWSREQSSALPESIKEINMTAVAKDSETGYLVIEYEFSNFTKSEEALKSKTDSVF